MIERMAGAYGTRLPHVIGDARTLDDMGQDFGAGLYAREVDYLRTREWANCAEDIIWRRSKLGLRLNASQVASLRAYIDKRAT